MLGKCSLNSAQNCVFTRFPPKFQFPSGKMYVDVNNSLSLLLFFYESILNFMKESLGNVVNAQLPPSSDGGGKS